MKKGSPIRAVFFCIRVVEAVAGASRVVRDVVLDQAPTGEDP